MAFRLPLRAVLSLALSLLPRLGLEVTMRTSMTVPKRPNMVSWEEEGERRRVTKMNRSVLEWGRVEALSGPHSDSPGRAGSRSRCRCF